ncbi:hypothetical protein OC861_002601 [Tilletia horrida]|nr:hypothetical protein OC861_002601 [Tilletia horrida]
MTSAVESSIPLKNLGSAQNESRAVDEDVRASSRPRATDEPENVEDANSEPLDRLGVCFLALQHVSSSFGYRAAEFAFPLYFVELFTQSLLPASLYGFCTTAGAIIFSGSVGHILDGPTKRAQSARADDGSSTLARADDSYQMRVIRNMILIQKLLVGLSYGGFLIMFLKPGLAEEAQYGQASARPWILFTAITILGCGIILCNVGISVGIERAWVTLIARSDSRRLIKLNAIMRRVDLCSNLLAPLFVSLLTSVVGYPTSAIVLVSINGASAVFEWIWLEIVFRRFPQLAKWHQYDREENPASNSGERSLGTRLRTWSLNQIHDWQTFARMPIFISTCSIALLYLSVLSFDSTFIAYLKSETTYSDAFIAGMRGAGVVAGLLGTLAMPLLENSLFAQVLPLIMSVVALYVGADKRDRPAWNGALLFTGIALSRIGLWSFDLAQLAQVQRALDREKRKNALMGLQFALQNFFDLGHYALTIGWRRPDQFKFAAAVSFGAVVCATILYLFFYARRLRGHLVHLDRIGLDRLLTRKER